MSKHVQTTEQVVNSLRAVAKEAIHYRSCTLRSRHDTVQMCLNEGDLLRAAQVAQCTDTQFTKLELTLIGIIDKFNTPTPPNEDNF